MQITHSVVVYAAPSWPHNSLDFVLISLKEIAMQQAITAVII